MQELGPDGGFEWARPLLDQAQAEVDVAEQAPLLGRAEGRASGELNGSSDVVQEGGGEQEVRPQSRVKLTQLSAHCGHANSVLEQSARVDVVALGRRRQSSKGSPQGRVAENVSGSGLQAGMRDLGGEELEEPFQLVGVAAERRREVGWIEPLGRLERANLELEAVAEALDPPEDPDGVAFAEAAVEQVYVAPDPRLDTAARIDELEREVRGARPCAKPLLLGDRVDALDDPVLLELGDRSHGSSLGRRTDGKVAALWP